MDLSRLVQRKCSGWSPAPLFPPGAVFLAAPEPHPSAALAQRSQGVQHPGLSSRHLVWHTVLRAAGRVAGAGSARSVRHRNSPPRRRDGQRRLAERGRRVQRGRSERREGGDGVRSIDLRGRDAGRWSRRSSQMPTATSRTGGRAAFSANAARAQVAARLHAAWSGSGTVRQATIGLLVALAYCAGARLGFLRVFPGSPLSVIWPPNAIVLAALLLLQPRAWWIVLLGVLPAHLVVEWQSRGVCLAAPGLYLTNCGEALLGP